MTFGVSHHKDDTGSDAWNRDGLLARMIKRAKDAAPELMVISDTCFCEYTSHGHCGVIHGHDVHNDHTIENLGRQSIVAAEAGADMIAPSSMMDGQVQAIRDGSRRQRLRQHPDHGLLVEVRLRFLWTLPHGRRMRPGWRPQGLPDKSDERTGGIARVGCG